MKEKDNPIFKLEEIIRSRIFSINDYKIIIGYKDFNYIKQNMPRYLYMYLAFDCESDNKKKYGFTLQKRQVIEF